LKLRLRAMIRKECWLLLFVLVAALLLATGSEAAVKGRALYSFTGSPDGSAPQSAVVFDKSGNLYGTTTTGGTYGCGTAFELIPSNGGWVEKVIFSFNCSDGGSPNNLVFDKSGNLYGTAPGGGSNGLVFELTPSGDTWIETVLYVFGGGKDGAYPTSGLTFDSKGRIYGTTENGGGSQACDLGCGTVFRLSSSKGKWVETVIHRFKRSDGAAPSLGSLIFDHTGNLYGTTAEGGSQNSGTVFKLTNSGGKWTESVLYGFSVGGAPEGSVIADGAGNLYGVLYEAGDSAMGAVFELMPSNGGWSETILHSFTGGNDGYGPFAGLAMDKVGNLYGTTLYGGGRGNCRSGATNIFCGTVYEMSPAAGGTWTETVIYSLGGKRGIFPLAPVLLRNGSLFGTAWQGGTSNDGVVFRVTP